MSRASAFWWEDPSFPQLWALGAAVLGPWPLLSLSRPKVEAFLCDCLGSWSSPLRSSAGGPWRCARILFSLPDAPGARAQHLPCGSLLSPVLQISTFLPASPRPCTPQLSTRPLWLFTALPRDISQPGSLTRSQVLLSLWADIYIHSRMSNTSLAVSYWCSWGILMLFLLEFESTALSSSLVLTS